jgi:hypothetical protein
MASKGDSRGGRGRKGGIHIKSSHAGKLRSTAKVKTGQKIPVATLQRLANSSSPKTRARAQFALNARKWKS